MKRQIVYRYERISHDPKDALKTCLIPYGAKLSHMSNSQDVSKRELGRTLLGFEERLRQLSEVFLPERFRSRGYDRMNSVFARPFRYPRSSFYPLAKPDSEENYSETVIKILVDPQRVLVLPMRQIDWLYQSSLSESESIIKFYWESAVSLREFRKEYSRIDKEKSIWQSKNGKRIIWSPEVIIPKTQLDDTSLLLN